jgi:hypothetical protein
VVISRAQMQKEVSTGDKKMNKKLKPIPSKNKGLKKLPKKVRNKMGFKKKGGIVK